MLSIAGRERTGMKSKQRSQTDARSAGGVYMRWTRGGVLQIARGRIGEHTHLRCACAASGDLLLLSKGAVTPCHLWRDAPPSLAPCHASREKRLGIGPSFLPP